MGQPKYGGRDCELSTTGMDASGRTIDAWDVTRHVLAEVGPALVQRGAAAWSRRIADTFQQKHTDTPYSMDCLRQWTQGGQCYYADMAHVEVCTASTLYPTTFAAQCLSSLLVAEAARRRAEESAGAGVKYTLSASNADTLDPAISFGSHLSMSVDEQLWDELFVEQRHPAVLGFVSSAMAAAIPFFGAGYLLALSDGSTVYSLSARAHHLSRIKTLSTTQPYQRGLLNTRREPHGKPLDRLHLIGFDYCPLSSALLFSLLQCVLVAAEESFCGLNLFDPVRAMRQWSWNLDRQSGKLPARAAMIDGRQLTLPEYLRELVETLLRMCEAGLITPALAPQATQMLPRIVELTHYAEEGSLVRCGKHLTWAAKLLWITDLCDRGGARFGDAQCRLADHDFTHTDPRQGAIWRLWEAGLVDPLVDRASAEACIAEGPAESRDWGRGQILARFPNNIGSVNWSEITLRESANPWDPQLRIELPQLGSLNREQLQPLLQSNPTPRQLWERIARQTTSSARQTDPLNDVTTHLATVSCPRSKDEDHNDDINRNNNSLA